MAIDFGALPCGNVPLDVDTFSIHNGGTIKEHVGRTYAGVDEYCPLAAFLGTHGFCLEFTLRSGTSHSASETEYNIERLMPLAAKLPHSFVAEQLKAPLLARANSAFDSAK